MIFPTELVPIDTAKNSSGLPISYTTASGRTVQLSSGSGDDGTTGQRKLPSSPRNTFTASFSFSQVINTRLQGSLLLDMVYQSGYLGLPFHRVYFADSAKAVVEALPSQRFKLPVGFRLNYFLGDHIILRTFYRFYMDNWGLISHTASLEVPVKMTPFFSISPFYRYYVQTAVNYFAPYGVHTAQDQYYTSNYSLSAFSSQFYGTGIRWAPPKGIGGSSLKTLEIRYGHYTQTTDLMSDVISLNLQFK